MKLVRLQFIAVLFLVALADSTSGTHIVNGYFQYTVIAEDNDSILYEVVLNTWLDCKSVIGPDELIKIGVYNDDQSMNLYDVVQVWVDRYEGGSGKPGDEQVNLKNCYTPEPQCIRKSTYTFRVTLPKRNKGFILAWVRCCRTNLNNLINGNNGIPVQGNTFFAYINTFGRSNSSAKVRVSPVMWVCKGNSSIQFPVTDSDGDSLAISFPKPYAGGSQIFVLDDIKDTLELKNIEYANGYTVEKPFGSTAFFSFDNGKLRFTNLQPGIYAFAMQVDEFRNDTLVGTVRYDLSLTIYDCGTWKPGIIPQGLDAQLQEDSSVIVSWSICEGMKQRYVVQERVDQMAFDSNGSVNSPEEFFTTGTRSFGHIYSYRLAVHDSMNAFVGYSDTAIVKLDLKLDVQDMKAHGLKVYPNPVHDILKIESEWPIKGWSLINITGQVLDSEIAGSEPYEIMFTEFKPGIYFLQIEFENGVRSINKVIHSGF